MSTTQIQPENQQPSSQPPRPESSDFYDPRHWETAYREMHNAPALLIQLQDDLSRSRQREAFWISVVVHILIIIAILNLDKLVAYLPKSTVMVVAQDSQRQKQTTFLELPKDEQQVTKRPDTDKLSDKDRVATAKRPHIDPKELKKIIDSARAGAPGPSGPPLNRPPQPAQPQSQAQAQANPGPPQPQQAEPPQQSSNQTQVAKLTPPVTTPPPTFKVPSTSPGAQISEAARAAAANRGGYGGSSGDYGLNQGRQLPQTLSQFDVLSDTRGVDFGPYLARVLHDVRDNWYNLVPEVARNPIMKKGKVSIEFSILKDGRVEGMRITQPDGSSGDTALDRAAWGGITASNPFPPLPGEFPGNFLELRFHFYYNPERDDLQ